MLLHYLGDVFNNAKMIEGIQNFLSAYNVAVLSRRHARFPVSRNVCLCTVQGTAVLSKTNMFDKCDALCPSPWGTRHRVSYGE